MTDRVLVVDDDPTVRASLSDALGGEGISVTVAENGVRALAALAKEEHAMVLCDVRMPEMDGLALLRELRARAPDVDVILMTAYDDMDTVVTAMREGAIEFLVKPIGFQQVVALTERVFEDRRLRHRSRGNLLNATSRLGDLVGRTPAMISLYKAVGQAAATRATVLIRGESGTGKELVARAIHSHSQAASEPFVPVNCAALPPTRCLNRNSLVTSRVRSQAHTKRDAAASLSPVAEQFSWTKSVTQIPNSRASCCA